jgi:hypothetical protein
MSDFLLQLLIAILIVFLAGLALPSQLVIAFALIAFVQLAIPSLHENILLEFPLVTYTLFIAIIMYKSPSASYLWAIFRKVSATNNPRTSMLINPSGARAVVEHWSTLVLDILLPQDLAFLIETSHEGFSPKKSSSDHNPITHNSGKPSEII